MLLAMDFSYTDFYHSKFPSVSTSLSVFIVKGCGSLSNSYIASTEMIFFPLFY